ncbi:MAG TPA: hypothetical protein ENJ97_02910, partial [Planctomycetes bacterium]|nr:hypothetical protein [Planctomycetota bacterium]
MTMDHPSGLKPGSFDPGIWPLKGAMSTPSKDPKPPRVVPVAPRECPPDLVKEVARILLEGGLVVLPTETVYGVAALLDGKKGESRLRALKGREGEEKPFTI